jgi:hypothetical protein
MDNKLLIGAFLLIMYFCPQQAKAQFLQRFSFSPGIMTVSPSGHPDFSNGAGLQATFTRNYTKYFSVNYSLRDFYGQTSQSNDHYNFLGFGMGAHLNILPKRTLCPFIEAEVNIGYSWLHASQNIDAYKQFYSEQITKTLPEYGTMASVGLEYKMGKNLSLYYQFGQYFFVWNNADVFINLIGIRINLFKDKNI